MKRRIPRERKALELGLRPPFVVTVTLALASVVGAAIVMVNLGTAEITRKMRGDLLSEAVVFSNGDFQCRAEESRMEVHPTGVHVIPFTYNDFGKGRAGEGT